MIIALLPGDIVIPAHLSSFSADSGSAPVADTAVRPAVPVEHIA
jgi:hypothetical protein